MFVPHAKVRIVGLGPRPKKKRFHRRRLAIKELIKMPCLLPTVITILLGLLAVVGGTGMAVAGYLPRPEKNTTAYINVEHTHATDQGRDVTYYLLKACSYLGPLIMAFGMFAIIVAFVLYCEIIDKYSMVVPDTKAAIYNKDELYQIIIGEMKKSYAQSLITAYSKITERGLTVDTQSYSGEYMSESLPYKPAEPLTLDQQIDIECEGYTPSPPINNKRYSIIQARIQRLRSEDNWLKTSSLPNIRRSENASIRRAGRAAKLRQTKNHSLSCDYTMDEARLRRKSMMLRSFLLGNSCSSGELQQKRGSRRFSSVKVLPTENAFSWDEISQIVNSTGSFPMTRLVQRRGTFACGDMRTRRMKFLLLLQASESRDKLPDNISIDGRSHVSGIRRKSFIPYTDCDRFIATEEKKRNRDRRPSFNPFIPVGNRLGHTEPENNSAGRRHSFFPIRRDDQIYVSDPYEQRRHSFNPIGVNNVLKPEYANKSETRRGSFNPDALHNRSGDTSRRGSYIPPQKSTNLMVPGVEVDKLFTERYPAADVNYNTNQQTLQVPEHHLIESRPIPGMPMFHGAQDGRNVERRHSYNPPMQQHTAPNLGKEFSQNPKVPKIVIHPETSGGFLSVPSQEYNSDERRHSFNCGETTKSRTHSSTAVSFKRVDRPVPQRLSFRLSPDNRISSPTHHHLSPCPVPLQDSIPLPKSPRPQDHDSPTSPGIRRPSSFKENIIVFRPLNESLDSRSVSASSNVSCCGSERVGATRTASISSERTTRTASPLSVAATTSRLHNESLERPLTPVTVHDFERTSPFHAMSPEYPYDIPRAVHEQVISPIPRRHLSFKSKHPRARRKNHGECQTDSPASTGSGPATLFPSTTVNANTALQRSNSASAITSSENASTPPFVSYAMLSPSASTARPTIKDKTFRGKQRLDIDEKPS